MTELELMEYREAKGDFAAASLLLLAGPDGFEGDFNKWMQELGAYDWMI